MANAADVLVERLRAWGVSVVFGLPGDGIKPQRQKVCPNSR